MKVAVVGLGDVAVTAACVASHGHDVWGVNVETSGPLTFTPLRSMRSVAAVAWWQSRVSRTADFPNPALEITLWRSSEWGES
jgi:hypothetical protein